MLALVLVMVLVASPKESLLRDRVEAVRTLLNEGRDKEARAAGAKLVKELTAAARAKDHTAQTLVLLGRTQLYLAEDEAAALSLDEAISLAPDDVDAQFYRGMVALALEAYEPAERYFRKATELAPKEGRGWLELGRTLRALKKPKEAIAALQQALTIDPNDVAALSSMGVALLDSNRGEEGIALLEKALTLRPTDELVAYNAGQYYQSAGKHRLALQRFEITAKADPNDWHVRAKLVQLHQALGEAAGRDLRRAEVFALHRAKKIDSRVRDYCREQFDLGGKHVLVYESFELTGERAVRYSFRVASPLPETKLERVVSLGSYDFTTSYMRSSGELKPDQRAWHLDGYFPDNSHQTYGIFTKEPSYEATRKMVVDVLEGRLRASSGTSPGK